LLSAAIMCVALASCAELSSQGETSSLSGESSTNPTRQPGNSTGVSDLGLPTSAPLAGLGPDSSKTINLASGGEFILHVPSSFNPAQTWPAVLALPGWKETAD